MTATLNDDEIDIALKRFDTVLRYYVYENTVYWSRSQFFLVANAGVLAVFASIADDNPIAATVLAIVGFAVSLLWRQTLVASQYWTSRWENICISLESKAFGETEVLRNCRPDKHISTKNIAVRAAGIFMLVWIFAIVAIYWPNIKTEYNHIQSISKAGHSLTQ